MRSTAHVSAAARTISILPSIDRTPVAGDILVRPPIEFKPIEGERSAPEPRASALTLSKNS